MKKSLKQHIAENQRLPCEVRGCNRRRSTTWHICTFHHNHLRRNGHESAHHIEKREWVPYLKEVKALFRSNKDHKALAAAVEVMRLMLIPGPDRKQKLTGPGAAQFHLWRELVRLRDANVSPQVALETVTSIWLLSMEQPARLPDDRRLTYAMANAVFKLAHLRHYTYWTEQGKKHTNGKAPGSLALNLLGQKVRDELGVFILNVGKTLEAQKKEANDRKAALYTPMQPIPLPPIVKRKPAPEPLRLHPASIHLA